MKRQVFLLLVILFFCQVAAIAKAPRWKMNAPKTSPTGIHYSLTKPGKGAYPSDSNLARIDYCRYNSARTQVVESSLRQFRKGTVIDLHETQIDPGFRNAIKLLRKGGKGFFSWRNPKGDSVHYYIRLREILPPPNYSSFFIEIPPDSIPVRINDPEKENFGDSTILIVTLAELPALMPGCDSAHAQMYVMLKFRERYFDNGIKYRDVLVAVPCVNNFETGFFYPGNRYLITALSWHKSDDVFREVTDAYSASDARRYRCLRITKG
ncbi:MAG: hypothetical protein IM638_06175 [Bacteroidetes bacterium]|nr:hypothetical protein [Bacteroidota bacterium]